MGKVIWHEAEPYDPMFKEGQRSYSPHWALPFHKSKRKPVERPKQPKASKAKPRKRVSRNNPHGDK